MEKGKSTAIGAVLLSALLLRPAVTGLSHTESAAADAAAASKLLDTTSDMSGKGPWTASCKYWAAIRTPAEGKSSPEVKVEVTGSGKNVDTHVVASGSEEDPCPGAEPWGIPHDEKDLQITTIVAAVPDPLHAHMALLFDRTIDALLQAAADNDFVSSDYWIPWGKHFKASEDKDSTADSSADTAKQQRQPGLIVLKNVPDLTKWKKNPAVPSADYLRNSYSKVIYLFLVRSSPITGMDGNELARAFQYEQQLREQFPGRVALSRRTSDCWNTSGKKEDCRNEMAVIGSTSTGTVASLERGIEGALRSMDVDSVRIAGGTSTKLATDMFLAEPALRGPENASPKKGVNSGGKSVPLQYVSFGSDEAQAEHAMLQHLMQGGYSPGRIAFLEEDGSTFTEAVEDFHAESDTDLDDPVDTSKKSKTRKHNQPFTQFEKDLIQFKTKTARFRFPRGISLLRNAHRENESSSAAADSSSTGPYLHMSLRDESVDDTVPKFSGNHIALSQEAQLTSIVHRLSAMHTQIAVIQSSNVLDEIYLSKFLREVLPDIRIVSLGGGDLLYEREVDNVPFVGEVTIAPYSLVSPMSSVLSGEAGKDGSSGAGPQRAFSDSDAEIVYNAASYTFWDGEADHLRLANYRNIFDPDGPMHASLWATLVGRDGYYPLGILNECASNNPRILPSLVRSKNGITETTCKERGDAPADNRIIPFQFTPPISWFLACLLVAALCVSHVGGLYTATLWSPLTRDLAIDTNDEPRRRSLYVHIGTSMLFCMAWVLTYPLFPVMSFAHPLFSAPFAAALTFAAACVALLLSWLKTRRYRRVTPVLSFDTCTTDGIRQFVRNMRWYRAFHRFAVLALLLICGIWLRNCGVGLYSWTSGLAWLVPETSTHEKLFFSYRCLSLFSGVSPALPVLLLLFGWFLWAIFQTRRMRFSEASRPRLPQRVGTLEDSLLYIADDDLDSRKLPFTPAQNDQELYTNMTCLLITRELVGRIWGKGRLKNKFLKKWNLSPDKLLVVLYLAVAFLFLVQWHIDSPERIFRSSWVHLESLHRRLPTTYGFLVEGLFLTLMFIALTGWLRTMLVWNALNGGLLRRLEMSPLRQAFDRMDGLGWMAMLRQNGLIQRWKEMSRSLEGTRQMVHVDELWNFPASEKSNAQSEAKALYARITGQIDQLMPLIPLKAADRTPQTRKLVMPDREELCEFRSLRDVPSRANEKESFLMYCIEKDYADFGGLLLESYLLPHWKTVRTGLVASKTEEGNRMGGKDSTQATPADTGGVSALTMAEEYLALRYLSMIRAVLVNIREMMTFVVCAFLMSIISWNSYPFMPREWADTGLTGLLLIIFSGLIWVFAQMHRDPLLSRITNTRANELGLDFYIRIATFGAVPLLTWLAYQFPSISSTVAKYLQPGVAAMK